MVCDNYEQFVNCRKTLYKFAGFANKKYEKSKAAAIAAAVFLLLAEGLAIGTLVNRGIGLMGAHQNAIQGTEIGIITVISTLLYCAFNALVCMAVHIHFLL